MKIKCGRHNIEFTKDDIIFDNGFCFQITIQQVGSGWDKWYPVVAKNKAKNLIKENKLLLF